MGTRTGKGRFHPDRETSVLLASLFAVMVGNGSTLTMLPAHLQRAGGHADGGQVDALQVGFIVAAYAAAGLVAAPLVGRLSDRLGRRPVMLAAIAGLAASQLSFALVRTLWALYVARTVTGVADATLLVAATAFIADATSEAERPRGMAWLGTTTGFGLVVGPALTGVLTRSDLTFGGGLLRVESHAIPFLFSGLLGMLVLAVVHRHVRHHNGTQSPPDARRAANAHAVRESARALIPLLLLVLVAQYGLAIFEGLFVVYAGERLSLGLGEIGLAFAACNLVIALLQLPAIDWLTGRVSTQTQVAAGFAVMGVSLVGLLPARSLPVVLAMAGAHGAGGALLVPNLSSLVTSRAEGGSGVALGLKSSAGGIGQLLGPLAGSALMGLRADLPFLVAGTLLVGAAIAAGVVLGSSGRARSSSEVPGPAIGSEVLEPLPVLASAA